MTSISQLRQPRRSRCSSRSIATSTPPSRTCRPRSTPRPTCCRATLPAPPTYSKSNPADTPILTLAVTSDTLPLQQVDDYADSILAQKISQVSGVGLVTLNGGQKPAVRVQVDPDGARRLRAQPRGRAPVARPGQRQPAQGQPRRAAPGLHDRRQRPARNGAEYRAARHRLQERRAGAAARRGQGRRRRRERAARRLGERQARRSSSTCSASRAPTSSRSPTASRRCCRSCAPRCRRRIDVTILTDRTETVRASVDDVQFTLVLTIALVVAGHLRLPARASRATIIPGVAVPLSLVGTFGVMYLLGYSLNNLSLMALTISTGFVVDDAIVMIENIARYIEEGEAPVRGRAQGRQADRLHHRVADGVAGRGADPAAVHGRHHRPAVPRVRGHARDRDRRLGGALADADRR